jgi:hypothetical protein
MIPASDTLSPIVMALDAEDASNNPGAPKGGVTYAAVRFMPDGTCRVIKANTGGLAELNFSSLDKSFVTMYEDDGKPHEAAPPANFYTIQIDPYTGKSRSYRPGF